MPHENLRDFIQTLDAHNHIQEVNCEVDWNLELSHIAKINETHPGGGKALLFNNVKGYPGKRVFISAFTARERLALALDMPISTSLMNLSLDWAKRIQKRIPPVLVQKAPCKDNIILGDEANITQLPAPFFYPKDGGRYVGTGGFLVTRNIKTGRLNLGTYRLMIYDDKKASIMIIKGKDAQRDLNDYAELNMPMPVAYVIGVDPVVFLCASTISGYDESEYDIAGALRSKPVELVKAECSDLLIPADAEYVIEGEISPGTLIPEGPFGEYSGYYSSTSSEDREFIKIKCITHKNALILWATTVGKPVTDTHMIMSVNRTASLWNDLMKMQIPGIKAVYGPPPAAGRMLVIISIKTMYHGHSAQVGLAAFASITGNYGLKTVILVDDDIDPENIDQVLYALSFRYQPERGTQILHRGRSTPLDPSLISSDRYMTSKIIIDCTIPFEWKDGNMGQPVLLDPDMESHVRANWENYFK